MDHFGIGVGVRGSVLTYLRAARNSGRTVSLIESLKDGDRVVFMTAAEAQRVQRLCAERKVSIECSVIKPTDPRSIFNRGTPKGRLIFDHEWVEQYYLLALDRAQSEIDHFQREAGGEGEAHRATRRCAEEFARWMP